MWLACNDSVFVMGCSVLIYDTEPTSLIIWPWVSYFWAEGDIRSVPRTPQLRVWLFRYSLDFPYIPTILVVYCKRSDIFGPSLWSPDALSLEMQTQTKSLRYPSRSKSANPTMFLL